MLAGGFETNTGAACSPFLAHLLCSGCIGLNTLPDTIGNLTALQTLNLE